MKFKDNIPYSQILMLVWLRWQFLANHRSNLCSCWCSWYTFSSISVYSNRFLVITPFVLTWMYPTLAKFCHFYTTIYGIFSARCSFCINQSILFVSSRMNKEFNVELFNALSKTITLLCRRIRFFESWQNSAKWAGSDPRMKTARTNVFANGGMTDQ